MEKKVHPLQDSRGRVHGATYRAAAGSSFSVDSSTGVMKGVLLCQAMQPKGMAGTSFIGKGWDETTSVRIETPIDFIEKLVSLSAGFPEKGQKARFGHPGMCDEQLGKHVGYITNIRQEGDAAIGDITLSKAAQLSPDGNLYEYVLQKAAEDPDAIMMSIVFQPGAMYFYDEAGKKVSYEWGNDAHYDIIAAKPEAERVLYETVVDWSYTDFVHDGANTNNLFRNFKGEPLMAATVFDFLDANPDVLDFMVSNREKTEQFLRKYEAIRGKKSSVNNSMNKNQKSTQTILGQLQKGIADLFRGVKNAEGNKSADAAKSIETTTDSGVAISIETEADVPAVGDQVYLAGTTDVPPAGDHVLTGDQEGYTITTDDAGLITAVVEPAATTEEPPVTAPSAQENAVDAEATTRQIETLATSMRSMQTVLEQVLNIQKANSADLSSIKSSPFGQRVFPGGNNLVTNQRGASDNKPMPDWEKEMIQKTERNVRKKQDSEA
jgi:hypothetical protein